MAELLYPAVGVDPYAGYVQGRAASRYTTTDAAHHPALLQRDFRRLGQTTGEISNVVVVKSGGVESPFPNALVRVFRAADGLKVWECKSGPAGEYTATGLTVGGEYVVLATDPMKNQKATAAGLVVATLPTP